MSDPVDEGREKRLFEIIDEQHDLIRRAFVLVALAFLAGISVGILIGTVSA